ncbi:MAG TPA: anthranilate phosphoribosyltransferase [Propionibacteriaceae bacterium]|nr:anthranilate phosphoribosyltransferase [Propionibacteriaceae bacterium]
MTDQVTWPRVLSALSSRHDLGRDEIRWAMGEVLSGEATPAQIAAFSVLLRAKGESAEEIAALLEVTLANATPIDIDREGVDIVGTGGDRAGTVNISTMAAITAAGAGARVIKHGNRAASSRSGTADCLEALGVSLTVPPARQAEVFAAAGIVFLFAPLYHPSFRFAGPVRKEIGVPTLFNILGPLGNPARPAAMAFGVADAAMARLVADVLAVRGTRGLVFHGRDGLDELTTTTTSQVWVVRDGSVSEHELDARALGLARAGASDLVGGDAAHNAAVAREIFGGASGPVRDVVLLNAAAALVAYRGVDDRPLDEQFAEQIVRAARSIDSGAASDTLERWVAASRAASA